MKNRNITPDDAAARMAMARCGSLVNPSVVYLRALEREIEAWLADVRAKLAAGERDAARIAEDLYS